MVEFRVEKCHFLVVPLFQLGFLLLEKKNGFDCTGLECPHGDGKISILLYENSVFCRANSVRSGKVSVYTVASYTGIF